MLGFRFSVFQSNPDGPPCILLVRAQKPFRWERVIGYCVDAQIRLEVTAWVERGRRDFLMKLRKRASYSMI